MLYTDVKVLGSDEGIKLELSDGEVLGTIFGDPDRITLWIIVGTDVGYLHVRFDGSNYGKLECLLL